MKIPFVDLKAQYLSIKEEIDNAISNVIEETAFIGGKFVRRFEDAFAAQIGVKHCVSCANGTDAIYIVLKMLGIGHGDEVITTAISWISTSETIGQTGATPVFVDVDDYYTIDVELIESKITNKTKAIIPVHLYGQSADMARIKEIAAKYNLYVIEDCAQSHLTQFDNMVAGTMGTAATFSFYPGKNLGAYGDAGCIITNDDELAEKCRMYANHGALKKHQHIIEGINSRLDGLQAAILETKLPHLKQWTQLRQKNAANYSSSLKDVTGIVIPTIRANTVHSFHLYVIRTENRTNLQNKLAARGVDTAIHYPVALPFMEAYKYLGAKPSDFPKAYLFQDQILSIPMYPELSEEQIEYVVESIREVLD